MGIVRQFERERKTRCVCERQPARTTERTEKNEGGGREMHEREREKKRKREREKEARKRQRIGLFC